MTTIRLTVVAWFCLTLSATGAMPAFAQGTRLIGLVRSQNVLLHFDSATPGTITAVVPVTGLAPGEMVRAIDVRPSNGLLYGLVVPGSAPSAQVRLIIINPSTGAASPVGAGATLAGSSGFFGISFDPVTEHLRVVNDNSTTARLNPETGTLLATDASLVCPAGCSVSLDGVAYDNQFPGATHATLYGINRQDQLVRIGGPQGNPSANGGAVTPIGAIGLTPQGPMALAFSPGGTLFAALSPSLGLSNLYTVNTSTGSASLVGTIGDGSMGIDGVAVPRFSLQLTPGSGTYSSQQRFDMVLFLDAPGRAIVGGSAIFDGIDVTSQVVACARFGQTAAGVTTIRCASLGGPLFGPGNHTFTVRLDLSGGDVLTSTARWTVVPSTEP